MPLRYSTHTSAERIVAAARLALAVVALSAFEPFGFEELLDVDVASVDAVYLFFAVVTLVVAWRRNVLPGWTMATHAVDVVFFGAQLFMRDDAVLPRGVCFFFPIVAASLLFGWKQVLLTTMALTAAFVAAAVYVPDALDALSGGSIWAAGISYVVLASLLVFDRSREEKLEREISALSNWPLEATSEVPVRDLLSKTATVLGVQRLIMTWEEPDEPWLHIAWFAGDEFQWIRESPVKYEPLIVEQLKGVSFTARHLPNASAVLFRDDKGFQELRVEPLNSMFRRDFAVRDLLSVALDGSAFNGRLFALNGAGLTADDLVFAEIVGRFVESRMDHYYLLQRAQQLGSGQERMRLSRDLHDGVLQSLTGASLQLEAVRGLIGTDPEEARRRLSDIQAVIATDQRELRSFIRELRPAAAAVEADRLAGRLSSLGDRYKQQWGVKVSMTTHGMTQLVSQAMRHEIYSIVSEGVANAAKHANARAVDVRVAVNSDEISIRIRDDGRGFPFTGRFTLAELNAARRGPVSLKERVSSLGGELVIDSTDSGSLLEIKIPLHWAGPDA